MMPLTAVLGLLVAFGGWADSPPPEAPAFCAMASTSTEGAPEYYQIELVSTKRVPGTAFSRGVGEVTFAPSPFAISVATDGSYRYDVSIGFEGLPSPHEGVYAAWLTTTQLDEVKRLGVVTPDVGIQGTVDWNQFIVVVSLEPSADAVGDRWSGPIVMRGLSRSGKMHTMAGHGPFQQENCATYGY